MTLTQPQRVSLGRLIALLRPDWDDAGTHDACLKLAGLTGDPFQLCAQAITQAAVAAHRTPEAICWPVKPGRTHIPAVRPPDDPCPTHGMDGYHSSGERICCWQDKHLEEPAVTPLQREDTRSAEERDRLRRLAFPHRNIPAGVTRPDEADPHCWSCGDRPGGCPRCADEDGVK